MKKKERKLPDGFDRPDLQVKLPRRDFSRMSSRQLLREGRRMYADLQALWRVELQLPNPDWEILASVSRQLKIFEERCPEVASYEAGRDLRQGEHLRSDECKPDL